MNFENLAPEFKEKALACKTPEELLALAKEEGYELTDEELEGIAGGLECSWYCVMVVTCDNVAKPQI